MSEDSFQFIIESPQNATGHKKRPRLVTSCDNCRLKKIKCQQSSPEAKCEACRLAKVQCRFKDRERYFAERSRAIASPTSGTYDEPQRNSSSNNVPYPPSALSSPESSSGGGGRYSPYTSRRSHESHRSGGSTGAASYAAPARSATPGYTYAAPPPPPLSGGSSQRADQYTASTRQLLLFDPESQQRPNPSLMPHFISLFLEHKSHEYPFLNYDTLATEFWEKRLSPILANCIASAAARYSNVQDIVTRGVQNVSLAYLDAASNILASLALPASLENTQALIVLSWLEYDSHRLANFRSYCQLAIRMSRDIGLGNHPEILSDSSRSRHKMTWDAILQLHQTFTTLR